MGESIFIVIVSEWVSCLDSGYYNEISEDRDIIAVFRDLDKARSFVEKDAGKRYDFELKWKGSNRMVYRGIEKDYSLQLRLDAEYTIKALELR